MALAEHRELDPVGVVAKVGNVLGRAGFLGKVVGRETEHHQPAFAVLGVQRLKASYCGVKPQ
jgi:hypothetical protein